MTRPQPTNAATTDPRYEQLVWDRPADKVRAGADAQYERLRARQNELRPEVVQAGLAKAYVEAKQQLTQMADQAPRVKASEIATLKRRAFGIDDLTAGMTPAEAAATQMSYRDAQARASQAGSAQEATALLDQAHQSGDELLARAIGNRALAEPGLDEVASAYLGARPAKEQAIQALQDAQPKMTAASLFEFAAPKPSELSGLSDQQIVNLAQSGG